MSKLKFLRCDKCGHTINLPEKYNGSKCRTCREGKYHPSKDLYVVNTDEEKKKLEKAFKMLSFTGYEIAILQIDNAGKLFSDDIVFASPDKESWGITGKMRDDYWVEPLESVFEFFSTDFSKYDRVIVCHTGNIKEKLMVYVLSYKFEKEGLSLYEMNLSCAGKIMMNSGFPIYHETDSIAYMWDFVVAAANPPERIEEFKSEIMHNCAERWRVLTRCQTELCICEGWEVINVPVSIYDNVILDVVSEHKYKRLPYVAGATMAQIDNVGESFIVERVIALARDGKLVLEEKLDVELSEKDLEERKKNPVQVQGVYVFPIKAVMVKAVGNE